MIKRYTALICSGCQELYDYGYADDMRKAAKKEGWIYKKGGIDLCPKCKESSQ